MGFVPRIVGGITAMLDDAPFPATKDVDVHLVFTEGSPMLRPTGAFPNLVEVTWYGLPIEAGLKPMAEYASPETVLANPEIAHHLTVDGVLFDPSGVLADLKGPVTRDYARRQWVRARVEHERSGFAGAFGMLQMARGMYGASGEANVLGYLTTFLVAALSVANLDPPKMGGQLFVRIRPLLESIDRLDVIEEILGCLGVAEMTREQAETYLAITAEAFDLAVAIRRTPHPFQHKMHSHLRPYLIDSCPEMIDAGYHREALAWMTPCLCSATDIILVDGKRADKARFAIQRDEFLRDIGFDSPDAGARKFALAGQIHHRVFASRTRSSPATRIYTIEPFRGCAPLICCV